MSAVFPVVETLFVKTFRYGFQFLIRILFYVVNELKKWVPLTGNFSFADWKKSDEAKSGECASDVFVACVVLNFVYLMTN